MCVTAATTDSGDSAALRSLADEWKNLPPGRLRGDPCRDEWVGIECSGSRVTSITLPNMNLEGELSGDLSILSELQQLDLSYNRYLTGPLPSTIGNLKKLTNLILVSCGFTGQIPDTIGSLPLLKFLSLNSNAFTGTIPPTIGNLSTLYWLDLADHQLEGPIPVSDGSTPGLDMLAHTKHFHFGKNKLSGQIPSKLFSSNMSLIHVLFENNRLTGILPPTLGLVQMLEVVRFDNNSLNGKLPSNLNNLTNVHELVSYGDTKAHSLLHLLIGPLPNLTGMSTLNTLVLKRNRLNGTLIINPSSSNQLQIIDFQNNEISDVNYAGTCNFEIVLVGNPVCEETGKTDIYSKPPPSTSLYSTPQKNRQPISCQSGQILSPTCRCAHPYTGTLEFRSFKFLDMGNSVPYETLEQDLNKFFQSHQVPVETISLSDPRMDSSQYLLLNLGVFPYGQESFKEMQYLCLHMYLSTRLTSLLQSTLDRMFSMVTNTNSFRKKKAHRATKRSNPFTHWDSKKSSGSIPQLKYTNNFSEVCDIGSGGYGKVNFDSRSLAMSNMFFMYAYPKHANTCILIAPWLHQVIWRVVSLQDIEIHNLLLFRGGQGSRRCVFFLYRKVYRGTLPTRELIAIKRAQQVSMQGGLEFKTEIEILSRVHHKNVISLFSFDRKSGIKLDWPRRLKVAVGSARGLAYLHELANTPIIHRDIKSKHGKYIVREVSTLMDKTKSLYNLREIPDPTVGWDSITLNGLKKFVDVALSCVEETRVDRPARIRMQNRLRVHRLMKVQVRDFLIHTVIRPNGVHGLSRIRFRSGLSVASILYTLNFLSMVRESRLRPYGHRL
ncbi:Leucine-rich repeat protein kinase family protein, putative isoform 2 [Hibiscus syriacus]|uniref:Leucine-rich repeat protein kinase family protein, putative isoform 2 n=1 Tax=Hibiscus syriacus TaxID=106335 RepID=A0A6A3AZF0_HIBSY|nr:Leucine-rich repeat protein kinase family protein, putative isoform 2 [Hibiscus syriacus]